MLGRRLLLWSSAFALTLQMAYYYSRLPDRVASHFATDGVADDWSSKGAYVLLMSALAASMLVLYEGLVWLLPRLPSETVNVPHRDYWLAPERRAETLTRIRLDLLELGFLTMLWLLAVNEVVLRANLELEPRITAAFWVTLAVFLVFLVGWLVRLYRRYARVPPGPTGEDR